MRGQSPAQQTSRSAPAGSDLTGFFLRDSEVLSRSTLGHEGDTRLWILGGTCGAEPARLAAAMRCSHTAAAGPGAAPSRGHPLRAPRRPAVPADPGSTARFTRGARLLHKTPPPFPPGRAEQKAAPRPEGRRGPLPSAAEQPCPAPPRSPAHGEGREAPPGLRPPCRRV